ncbi:hypothetical protein HC174_04760 [Salinimicrobium sp. CDJ15-81-2]|uniref:Uncharacterized protein n=1 Tax=Tamlana crocina TaxID=393006 RepID=A0ABX1DH67_9FLAO|nr:hypothetical protein [Tamlana crocina]NJX17089.1 hypothetical protein [Tamlana crocina]NJY62067.1 hypothetical protein [Salinimicrobium nanhaiense]
MENIQKLRNKIIDRVMISSNSQLLEAIEKILSATEGEEEIALSSEQIEMLLMSESDIENNRLISEEDLEKQDEEWLK